MSIDDIQIKKTNAGSTYGKWSGGPVEVEAGAKKTRLQFSAGQHSNIMDPTVTSVYAEKNGNGFFDPIKIFLVSIMKHKFVKCTHENETIYINVNSLSKRLGIAPKKIHSNAKSEKNLVSLIEESHKSYLSTQNKVDEYFKNLIQDKYIETDKTIDTLDGKSISKYDFYHSLGIAAFIGFKKTDTVDEIGYALKKGKVLHLKKQEAGEWPLLTLFTEKVLGSGFYGSVRVVEELSMGRVSVAKIAHNLNGEKDAQNEYNILGKISGIGIQEKPYSFFHFNIVNLKRQQTYHGYISPKYDKNLEGVISKLKPEEKVECVRQLLKGLIEMERQQICHGDIKELNCLFRRRADGTIACVIADFGGANDMKESIIGPQYGTPLYRFIGDDHAQYNLQSQYKCVKTQSEKDEINKSLKKLFLRRDIYSMGMVISMVLSNYKFSSEEASRDFKLMKNKMMNRSWEDRISASEVLKEFEKIFPQSSFLLLKDIIVQTNYVG